MDKDNISSRFFEVASSSVKVYVAALVLHESKSKILLNVTGDFDLNQLMVIGAVEHKTNNRFRKLDVFKNFIKATVNDFDSNAVTSSECVHELNTPQFIVVIRSVYGRSINQMEENIE